MGVIKSIYIYGKSGHGSVIEDIAMANGYEKIIYVDDDSSKTNALRYDKNLDKNIPFVVGIGDNKIRKVISNKLLNDGFCISTLIHPSAIVAKSARIQKGSVVMPLCVINANTKVGFGVILNSGCIIEHDCSIGDFAHVSPNAAIAGGCSVGDLTHVGIGVSVKECIAIGENCTIGAGSVVVKNVENCTISVGVPAKKIGENKNG